MKERTVTINRAPVLTLWGAIVAQRLGFDWDEALSLGKAVAGLNAQAKGRRLGIFKPSAVRGKKPRPVDREFRVEICGRPVPATNTPGGVRAVIKTRPIEPDTVEDYLRRKFGVRFDDARRAMRGLAAAYSRGALAEVAFSLYEEFRPHVAKGTRGWGDRGQLDLGKLTALARAAKSTKTAGIAAGKRVSSK